MRLLFIHGIDQQDTDEKTLLDRWKAILFASVANSKEFLSADIAMAYYGATLDQYTTGRNPSAQLMGPLADVDSNSDELKFLASGMSEIAGWLALSNQQIEDGARAAEGDHNAVVGVPMSTSFARRAVGIARVLEDISPWRGGLALRVIKQAYAYLEKPNVGAVIDALVQLRIGTGKVVIVSHSLGTIIAFKLLRKLAAEGVNVEVPLLVTLGSPLALKVIKASLGVPREVPVLVKRWVNVYDPGDPVTLGKPLDIANFAGGIENIGDMNNQTRNGHSIEGYLGQPIVVKMITSSL